MYILRQVFAIALLIENPVLRL
ncbi:MAG: hypothetical protein RLZZ435_3750, partial [Cyanobacteriota bacterium]